MREKYGWISQEQAMIMNKNKHKKHNSPYKIYLNKKNEEVIVTTVSDTKDHGCQFSDILFVDMVTEYVRNEP
tara:strand:- start:3436 stop:3651 length:216 start_codon:yes stop_codon:yes gene_type:complete